MHIPHQKLHPKNPVGKTVLGEKSTYQPHFVLHMLSHQKTLCEKPSSKNSQRKKRVQHKTFLVIQYYIVTILHE
jgi:hypothetical protein